jgi:nicotinamide mononucleotide adenylyltransferase
LNNERITSSIKKPADDTKEPVVIVACGSFSPITYLHLRIFEMAKDYILENTNFEIIGGYYSPVSDHYQKEGLAPTHHRVRMCELAVERTSTWLMVDAWESLQPEYTRTAMVLDHFNEEMNIKRGGIKTANGKYRNVKVLLLAGGDLIESFKNPGLWLDDDLHHILGDYGCLIVERTGSDVWGFLLSHDILYRHRKNVFVIKQLIYNDISSTKVRLFVKRGMSIKYLLPNSVIKYIQANGLYIS